MNKWANQHREEACCCEFSRIWKTELPSCWQHWDNLQFLETGCGFWLCAGPMLGPDRPIVQPALLWRWEIWDVPTSGTSGQSVSAKVADQAGICRTAVPVCRVSQGWGFGGIITWHVVLGAESVPASLVALGTRFSPLWVQPSSPD